MLVDYTGPRLRRRPGQWQVKVWTDLGESDWSDPDMFELGLLEAGRLVGAWIVPVEDAFARRRGSGRRCSCAASSSSTRRPVARARLYATAHGIYEAFVNGRRVGDAELTPGFTEYRTASRSRPTTSPASLAPGPNAIGAILSDGWFRGQVGPAAGPRPVGIGARPSSPQLRVDFADGSTVGRRHRRWLAEPRSHIEAADLIAGEIVDFTRRPDVGRAGLR